jgi:nucleotide-binding universal stress UspA family protein
MKRILVGFSGSDDSVNALNAAKIHAKAFNATVFVMMSMVGGPDIPRRDFVRAERLLEDAAEELKTEGIGCETHLSVRGLMPGEDLVTFAAENRIDEIVIGVRNRSRVGKFIFGSTAQYVILKAECPVVSVK